MHWLGARASIWRLSQATCRLGCLEQLVVLET